MTRKRFEGLMRALLTEMYKDDPEHKTFKKKHRGEALRGIKRTNVKAAGSYQAIWDKMLEVRNLYGME